MYEIILLIIDYIIVNAISIVALFFSIIAIWRAKKREKVVISKYYYKIEGEEKCLYIDVWNRGNISSKVKSINIKFENTKQYPKIFLFETGGILSPNQKQHIEVSFDMEKFYNDIGARINEKFCFIAETDSGKQFKSKKITLEFLKNK